MRYILVFSVARRTSLRRPRCAACFDRVTRDEIVAFDFESARMRGAVVRFDRLHGQALEFVPLTRPIASGVEVNC
jgi:hypothetical protein